MGRPKLYENEAARMAAFRAKNSRLDVTVTPEIGATIQDLADTFDVTKNQVCVSLIKFALTNRDWKKSGLIFNSKK